MPRLIDADALIKNLEGIISDYTSNGFYPEKFGIDDFIDLIKEIPTISAPQWISVEDKWPQNGQWVLAYLSDGNMITGIYYDAMGFALDYHYEGQGEITHWMELPGPPSKRYKCRYADYNGVCSKYSEIGEIVYCVEGPCNGGPAEEVQNDGTVS